MSSPLTLSYSRIRTFQTCQRKYYWEYERQIVPARRNYAMEFGSAWHSAMSAWHRTRQVQLAIQAFNSQYLDNLLEEPKRTRITAAHMLRLYEEQYPEEPFTVMLDEQELVTPIGPYLFKARLDKLIKRDDRLGVLEHKTTGWGIESSYFDQFKPGVQSVGYMHTASRVLKKQVDWALIDVAYVGSVAPRRGQRFLRDEVDLAPWMVDELETTIVEVGGHIQGNQEAGTLNAWLPNWDNCHQFGGCPYWALCSAPPAAREAVIATEYQPKPVQEIGL